MIIKTTTSIGKTSYEFHVDERNDIEALHKSAVLGNPPQYCPLCKNGEHFRLDSNKDKEGNCYVNVICKKCGAKAKLGQYKTGGFFWHKFEEWKKADVTNNGKRTGTPAEFADNEVESVESDGVPF